MIMLDTHVLSGLMQKANQKRCCNSALSNSCKPTWPIGWSCSMFVPLIWQPNWLLATNW
jgi:hypothetical protein